MKEAAQPPHYHGHRERLRERFAVAGADALADYELLELLLFPLQPRRDVKPLAKALIDRYGSLSGVLNAEIETLSQISGLGQASAIALKAIQAACHRMLRAEVIDRPVLTSWQQLIDYCRMKMAHSIVEEFRLLFLDRKNVLIADEVQQTGTVDHTPVYPREVIKRALELGASALIMVHNHPSGDPTPSKADIEMTRQIAKAAQPLGVSLHDHLIIGRAGKHASLKGMGLI